MWFKKKPEAEDDLEEIKQYDAEEKGADSQWLKKVNENSV